MNSFDTFLYKFLRYGLLAAVFVPLVVFRNSFSPFNFGKVIVFRILVELLLIAYIPLAIKYREFRIWNRGNYLFWFLTLFIASYAVSTFTGVNWHQSFWGYWERMGGLFTWLHYYIFLIILVSVFKTKEDWLATLWLSVIAAMVSTFYGFFQKFSVDAILGASGRLRIFGTLGNPAAFAGYLLFNFYFALYLLKQYSNKKIRICLIGVIVLFLTAILMTAVRGAALSLVVSVSAYLFLERKHTFKWADKKLFLSSTILLLVVVFLLSPYLSKFSYFERLTNFSINQLTVQQRVIVWKIALNGIFDNATRYSLPTTFFFGWGPENFSSVFSAHYDPEISKNSEEVFDKAHNILLDIGATQGFIGLLAWLFLITYLFRSFSRSKNYLFCSLIIAYLIHNFFFFDLFSSYLMLFILFGFGIYTTNKKVTEGSPTSFSPDTVWKPSFQVGVMVGGAILSGALIFYTNLKPALANFYSTRGYSLLLQKRDTKGLDYFKRAFTNANWSAQDVYKKFAESYLDYIFTIKKPGELHKNLLDDLIRQLESEVKTYDADYSLYIYLHKSYRAEALLFDRDLKYRSKDLLSEALDKFPAVLPLYYELFNYLAELEEFKEAELAMTKAYELDKDLPQSAFRLGLAYVLNGVNENNNTKKQKGLKLLIKSINENFILFNEINYLSKVLEKNKLYDDMIAIFEKLKDKRPEYNIHLAYVYLLKKDRNNAFKYADSALVSHYDHIGSNGFRLLSDIYKKLGDNKKRGEALLKSAP